MVNPEGVRPYLEQAREIDQAMGNRRSEGFSSLYLGASYFATGEFELGIPHAEHALKIARDIQERV